MGIGLLLRVPTRNRRGNGESRMRAQVRVLGLKVQRGGGGGCERYRKYVFCCVWQNVPPGSGFDRYWSFAKLNDSLEVLDVTTIQGAVRKSGLCKWNLNGGEKLE